MKMDISTEDLIAEMQRVVEENKPDGDDDPGLTTREWARVWGVSPKTTRHRLGELSDSGMLARGKKTIERLDGMLVKVPVYRAKSE